MITYDFIELIGYVGMIFVILSFTMKNIVLLRTFNIIGAILSCLYGFLTNTYATLMLNAALIVINGNILIYSYVRKKDQLNILSNKGIKSDIRIKEDEKDVNR